MPAASVIVPARNAASTITRTLATLAEQDFPEDYEVIVVDNASADDTGAMVARALPDAKLIRKEPGGVGSARNRGVAEASSNRIAFIDSDCYPTQGWLAAGMACLETADLVQGAVQPDPTAERAPFDRTVSVVRETGLYETANLFVRRELFEAVGGFEDWIIPDIAAPFGEDVWFGWQARRAGARTAFCERALAHHAVFPRSAAARAAEQRRCAYFPDLVDRVPELREEFLWNRVFLTRRTAAFDAALVSLIAAAASRSPIPLAGVIPYAFMAMRGAAGWRRRAPRALAGDVRADLVTLASLAKGSIRTRALVA